MSKIGNIMSLFIAFIVIMLIAFFAIGFTATVTPPSNLTSAGQQYENLSKVIDISNTGLSGVLVLLIVACVLAAAYYVFNIGKR